MLMKPPHGAACNGCGQCCMDQLCPLAEHVFGSRPGPCWALERKGIGYTCGLVEHPETYAPVEVLLHGRDAVSNAATVLIGAGLGCDALAPDEKYNFAWAARTKTRIDRATSEAAMQVWNVPRPNRTASDARTVKPAEAGQPSVSK